MTSWQVLDITVVLSATKDKHNSAPAVVPEHRWEAGDIEGTRGAVQKWNNWSQGYRAKKRQGDEGHKTHMTPDFIGSSVYGVI